MLFRSLRSEPVDLAVFFFSKVAVVERFADIIVEVKEEINNCSPPLSSSEAAKRLSREAAG